MEAHCIAMMQNYRKSLHEFFAGLAKRTKKDMLTVRSYLRLNYLRNRGKNPEQQDAKFIERECGDLAEMIKYAFSYAQRKVAVRRVSKLLEKSQEIAKKNKLASLYRLYKQKMQKLGIKFPKLELLPHHQQFVEMMSEGFRIDEKDLVRTILCQSKVKL